MLKRLSHDQEGNVIVFIALLMMIFMGIISLVIDVGIAYSEKAKLVSAVDAAALAGVWGLPDEDAAIAKAYSYFGKNSDDPSKITELQVEVLTEAQNRKIVSVKAEKNVGLFFANAIGFSETNVRAHAQAAPTPAKGVNRVIPVGISKANWENIQTNYNDYKNQDGSITLKVISSNSGTNNDGKEDGSGGFDPEKGNFYSLDLNYGTGQGGPGANEYRDYLAGGYPHMLYIGDERATETGAMVGPTKQGLGDRLRGNTCTIDALTKKITHTCGRKEKDCPRIGYAPIFDIVDQDLTGRTTIEIIGFFPIFIVDGSRPGEVRGVFLKDSIIDGAPGNDNTPEYGIYAPKLIR